MSAITLIDLRDEPFESLVGALKKLWRDRDPDRDRGMLVVSRRPSKGWTKGLTFARPLILSSASLYELILWVDHDIDLSLPDAVAKDQQELLEGYRKLFLDATEKSTAAYMKRLRAHIVKQEGDLYPQLGKLAPVERALRELSYEHEGLEKRAESLGALLVAQRTGKLTKRERERLDLDYFHLLEHHLEREREAIFPAWRFLTSR